MAKTPAKTDSTAVETERSAALRAIAEKAIAEMKADEFDPEQMMFDIMEAQSIDDVLGSEVIHLKDIIGTPMTVLSAQLQESKYEDSFLPAYAVMRVQFDDGNRAIVTTGAAQVVAALVKAHAANWFPFRCSSVMITARSGNDVVKLTPAPDKGF